MTETIIVVIQSDKEAYASVVFEKNSGSRNFADNVVSRTPTVTPARLVSLIDMAKKFDVLKDTHPDSLAGVERTLFQNRYRCGKYDICLDEAIRFDEEDTVIFKLRLVNLTEDEIKYDKHSFSAHAGDGIYYMSVSDASGIMPPKSETFAWFGITSTPRGGRNNLKADNDWLIALTTQEMHIENIQSVKDELREKERAETEAAAARAKQARDAEVKILTAERLIRELKQQQDDFARMKRQYEISFTELRRKLDMEKEKTERKFAEAVRKEHQARQMARQLREESIRETRDAAVSAIESMRKQTRDEIQTLRQRTDGTIRRLKPDCHGGK